MTSTTVTAQQAVEILRSHSKNRGWEITGELSNVPEQVGFYALYDGTECRGGGVSYNVLRSLAESSQRQKPGLPVFMWLPDKDGSAALWLKGRVRCVSCSVECAIDELDKHMQDSHNGDSYDEDEAA